MLVKSDATLLRRAATIVWDRGHVTNHRNIKTDSLHSANSGFTTSTWALDANFDFLETMSHGLPAGVLSDHLGGIGCAFTRAFESTLAGARPTDHSTTKIRDTHNRVVETGLDVSHSLNDSFAALGFDDLDRLNRIIQ